MIGTSLLEYIFIRGCIIGLQSVAPLSIIYCSAWLLSHLTKLPLPTAIDIPLPFKLWTLAEVIFYGCVNLIYREKLQYEALHPAAPARHERKELFDRCNQSIPDINAYLEKWFLGASKDEIKRDNVKEFFLWAFFNRDGPPGEDEDELEEYVAATEALHGKNIQEGRGNAVCLRLTIDGVSMSHRSILWYFCVGFVDFLTCLRLHYYGFAFRRTAFLQFLMIFPVRPFTLFATKRSPAKRLTYWHRPHTSGTRKPVVFVHGIGIGLYPYVNLLAQLDSRLNSGSSADDLVGIIAIEIMPVSFRITHTALNKDEMCDEIQAILKYHKFDKPVLVSHSYGTVITTQLLKSTKLADQIGPVVLIDPISILLHLPDVAYNFTRRKPQRANEHQLYYFASMDMGVSHSLSRCFFWSENVLWKNDIGHRDVTISLAGQDLIVNTKAVGDYLASHNEERAARKNVFANGVANGSIHEKAVTPEDDFANNIANGSVHENAIPENGNALTSLHQRSNGYVKSISNGYVKITSNGHVTSNGHFTGSSNGYAMGTSTALSEKTLDDRSLNAQQRKEWEDRPWAGNGVDIMWFPRLDHAQVFDKANTRERLVKAISEYSARVC